MAVPRITHTGRGGRVEKRLLFPFLRLSCSRHVSSISIFAPAKLNLFLAITGRRSDGFHDLVSLVAKVDLGDTLHAEPAVEISLTCPGTDLPVDDSNLVLKAARAFSRATGWKGGAKFVLEKRVPVGAGLGGGSSDAVAALQALNRLAEPACRLSPEGLAAVAADVGSDCPLFLAEGPVVMRGRGERILALPATAASRLRGRRVLIFKPGFAIATSWAYGQLAAVAPAGYLAPAEAEERLANWLGQPEAPAEAILFNNMERAAFAKFVALPVLLEKLESQFGVRSRMSGSGSACFALLDGGTNAAPIIAAVHDAWGDSAFVCEARLT